MPSARAPPIVASSSTVEESRKRRVSNARWMSMLMRISEIMSIDSVAAGESVPKPTLSPARKNAPSGAMPMPSWAFERAQVQMDTLYSRSFLMSSSSTCTAWMTSTFDDSNAPQFSA